MFTNTQRGIAAPALVGVVALVILLGSVYYLYSAPAQTPDDAMMEGEDKMIEGDVMEKEGDAMMDEGSNSDDAMMEEGDSMMETGAKDDDSMMEQSMMYSGNMLAGTEKAPLLDFTQADFQEALASDKLITLYFYANWCPICRAEFPKMEAAFDELNRDDVIGFRVNYNDNETNDAEKALAKEHGVAYQHTKVFIQNGERVLKSPEGWEKDRYLSEINKF